MAFRAARIAFAWKATNPANTTIRQYIKETLEEAPEKISQTVKKATGKASKKIDENKDKSPQEMAENAKQSVKQTAKDAKDTDYQQKAKDAGKKIKEEFSQRSENVLEETRREGMNRDGGVKKE
ncbi:hypothetical protein POMI540_3745 [Schizosaccharomyces pombe]|uniref:Uncharacterized protein C4F10.17 n=1 Tax=Schizosaccharomyces pombe (strain 972 / ATCC 24843) TaxID=284812 RepID=YEKH_SCHPO|nr:uncharacterized protein SPAC4F10.17 [Schizosaccharomyces pombe]O36029.1 RecName: Full=Uncharacterized protein C4F10.17 [Schizosaccharomyces pombe 972h-]CAB11720.1 conserved fungal protein [Schizosaccharomyces pombe]|eukprot:NP_594760.1 uncharacterized protein SPAC4F10.17 [Schizosaccharomyces pombe]